MRTLTKGEAPRKGSRVAVVFEGEVVTVSDASGSFDVENEHGQRWNFNYSAQTISGRNRLPVVNEILPPQRKFKTGVMYRSKLDGRVGNSRHEYFLRTETGWQGMDGAKYPDDSKYSFLLSHVVNSLVELTEVKG